MPIHILLIKLEMLIYKEHPWCREWDNSEFYSSPSYIYISFLLIRINARNLGVNSRFNNPFLVNDLPFSKLCKWLTNINTHILLSPFPLQHSSTQLLHRPSLPSLLQHDISSGEREIGEVGDLRPLVEIWDLTIVKNRH